MKTLKDRRKAAAFHNTTPTMTDQSAAATTDLNVIVNQFLKTGQSPNRGNPRYGDFSQLPTDLRGMIETSRSVAKLRRALPEQLKELPMEELLGLTPEKLAEMLAPKPVDPPAETKEKT